MITMQLPARPPVSYPIKIGTDLLAAPVTWLPPHFHQKRLVIITDDNVKKLYGEKLLAALENHQPLLLSFPAGEIAKNQTTKTALEEQMLQQHCSRETAILALGGGVVGDMAGFIAATYLRGIPYIQIPTTLLAMIDSSVGGKTGINTPQGKNLVGAFWQPDAVIIDLKCLESLTQTHMINGLAEAIKVFLTQDAEQVDFLKNHLDAILQKDFSLLKNVIESAINIKIAIVNRDEKEKHERMVLNFGHTIGHALEKISDYSLLHGYAVALGILVEAKISQMSGILSDEDYQMIQQLFLQLNISSEQLKHFDSNSIIAATKHDKKIQRNHIRYVLLKRIGAVCNDNNHYAHPVADDTVKKALHFIIQPKAQEKRGY